MERLPRYSTARREKQKDTHLNIKEEEKNEESD